MKLSKLSQVGQKVLEHPNACMSFLILLDNLKGKLKNIR